MRSILATLLMCSLVFAGLLYVGCAGNPAVVSTPVLQPATVTLLVTSLGALQAAAIVLGPVDGIPAADTAKVINTIPSLMAIIQAAGSNWVSAFDVALNKLPPLLTPATAATLSPYFNALQAVVTDLYGSGLS